MESNYNQLNNELINAFIDASVIADNLNKPEFICNDYKSGKKVISTLENELNHCLSFDISVAFITDSGVQPLLQTLKECESKGIKGRILTTDYNTFTQPKALEKLHQLSNIDLKMYRCDKAGFHTKGYIFYYEDTIHFLVGSSNLTAHALTINHEWNSKLVSTNKGEYAITLMDEFNTLWNSHRSLSYEDFFKDYESAFNIKQEQQRIYAQTSPKNKNIYALSPNKMQAHFISNLKELVEQNAHKALLISATGTGKTYASAFAVRELNPAKTLFLIHREQIALKSLDSYYNVFGNTKSLGIISGNRKDFDKDITFATMQTMSKDEILKNFNPDYFDLIIIDEAHRVGADSYLKIMDYFKPNLYLGMSASPERGDGFDVYKQFDHNIAAEIRLQQALEEDLLCPFHYFGITDIYVNNHQYDLNEFNHLQSKDRIDYIIENCEYYGYSGKQLCGLVFVSRNDEAKYFSEQFNQKGYKTICLTGQNSQEERIEAIQRLESENEDHIDYIFSVDIFNEGIDIPCVNQVVMVRPTQSAIIFVQQLGRGLRKHNNKEYVTILDFIGNYQSNYLIPIALSGDQTYNKDNIRRYVMSGERIIPGLSTIHFDEISRHEIFKSLDSANFSDVKLIKESYFNLKHKLGHIPSLLELDKYDGIDATLIFNNKSLGSYHTFLTKYEKEYSTVLNDDELNIIEFISQRFASGKRINELLLLDILLNYPCDDIFNQYHAMIHASNYPSNDDEYVINNLIQQFTQRFITGSGSDKYCKAVLIEESFGKYQTSKQFKHQLNNLKFKTMINEIIIFGKNRYFNRYMHSYLDTDLVLYEKYTYDDVCRLLNWQNQIVAQNIGGYKYDEYTKTYPVFINYHKDDDISESIQYEDEFISNNYLIAYSKSKRNLDSPDVNRFIHHKEMNIKVHLFVRKNKDDKTSKEFYYLGTLSYCDNSAQLLKMKSGENVVKLIWKLDVPVREDIYEYITNKF